MVRLLLRLQIAVLAIGTVFAWFTLVGDYRRFFSAGGRVFEWSGCVVANPLMTPCFYGVHLSHCIGDIAIDSQDSPLSRSGRPAQETAAKGARLEP